ncbi:MAG TPA: 2'-5' RNA ligase family protein [Stellaceae bacterium]|nr:2'-5' RNA ligase family protein [Stellaceae bacterium]
MGTLEVVARPEFGRAEFEWLSRLRCTMSRGPGEPAFTLVFPGGGASAPDIVKHVEATCATTPRIRFCLRSAVIVPEPNASAFHVFLVPDEGFGAIIRLHDRLHVGPLAGCLRPEVPYIPHLTVASTRDFDQARRTKASLNAHDLAIDGRIEAIEVHERDAGAAHCVARVPLARPGLFH